MNHAAQKFNPWPLAVIVYFVVFIFGIITFTTFATRQKHDLVSPDYYEDEVRFQQQIERATRTRGLPGNAAAVTYQPDEHRLAIKLPVPSGSSRPSGTIQLYRPADASLDRKLPLALDADGVQRIDTRQLKSGLWKVRVIWPAESREFSIEQAVIIASPQS